MFAHHVLRDLSTYKKPYNVSDIMLQYINTSTKYHFGDMVKNVHSIVLPVIAKYEKETGIKFQLFKSQMEGVVSPSDVVWFEWFTGGKEGSVSKYGSLILKSSSSTNSKHDLLTIYIFYLFKGKWDIIPMSSRVDMAIQKLVIRWMYDDEGLRDLSPNTNETWVTMNRYGLTCVNLCLWFLNCRNVKTYKQLPPPKLQKKREKKGRLPMFSYHILEIKDIRRRDIYPDGHTPTMTRKLRYHHMSARVVYYSAAKPLFGNPKNVGWYAFKDYWRGSPKKGIIISDYAIKDKL